METGYLRSRDKLAIVSVVGTRPEAIKIAPIALALSRHPHIAHRLIASGQQSALFADAIAGFGIKVDRHLAVHNMAAASPALAMLETAIQVALETENPDLVLVQGDTNSALAAAQAAASRGIAIGHVEAGLRTHVPDRPFPEERNRIEIAQLATLHFAPCEQAAINLQREGVRGRIAVTGNTGIDAMMMVRRQARPALRSGTVVTCHRRENFGAPLLRICSALKRLARIVPEPITVLMHPNPQASQPLIDRLGGTPNIGLAAPINYDQMIGTIENSRMVISDSGGIQEECAALGTPLILLREETERGEVVASGNAALVGSDPDRIVAIGEQLLRDPDFYAGMSTPSFPYGRGDAVPRIVAAIERHFFG